MAKKDSRKEQKKRAARFFDWNPETVEIETKEETKETKTEEEKEEAEE